MLYRKHGSHFTWWRWRVQAKATRSVFQFAYRRYWAKALDRCHDGKSLWTTANALLRKPEQVIVGHTAEHFADFFSNKVALIRATTAGARPPDIQPRPADNLDVFNTATVLEVLKMIEMSPASTCELDPIPTWLAKDCRDILAPIITVMIQMSLNLGQFPDSQKLSIIRPLLKKPSLDPCDIKSYRPISNLSFVSKLLERMVAKRIDAHVTNHGLLPVRQSAYRIHHSTETAIISVHNEIVRNVDEGNVCALVLLDMSAAFDTVDHSVLLQVLEQRFGFRDHVLEWSRSFLSQRSHKVRIGAQLSPPFTLPCSVPQGSVMGPKFFIKYTEDIAMTIESFSVGYHLYADDTQLLQSTKLVDIPIARRKLERCFAALQEWCASRRLKLNADKTELIWFYSKSNRKKLASIDLTLSLGSDIVEPSTGTRNLGVFLDNELTMRLHISQISSSCFFHLRRLRHLRNIISETNMQRLVSALVISRLDYCNGVLAGLPSTTLAPLTRVLHAAVRLVANLRHDDSVSEAMKNLHWLPISQRITYKLCLLMYKAAHGLCPSYIVDLLTPLSTLESRAKLRSHGSNDYNIPRVQTQFGRRAFSVAGPLAWNALPKTVQSAKDITVFKKLLKTHLFKVAYHLQL